MLDSEATEIVETVEVKSKWGIIKVVKARKGKTIVTRSIQFPTQVPVQVCQSLCQTRGGKFEPATPINPQTQMLSQEDRLELWVCFSALRLASMEVKVADWSTAYTNDLPDSAFTVILLGGKKDETGRTVPRSLRLLPYKDKNGMIDKAHVRIALSRVSQVAAPASMKRRALIRLLRIAKGLGMTVQAKSEFEMDELDLFQTTLERLEAI